MQETKPLPFGVLLIAALNLIVPLRLVPLLLRGSVPALFWAVIAVFLAASLGLFLRQLWALWLVVVLYVGNVVVAVYDQSYLMALVSAGLVVYLVLPRVRDAFRRTG